MCAFLTVTYSHVQKAPSNNLGTMFSAEEIPEKRQERQDKYNEKDGARKNAKISTTVNWEVRYTQLAV